MMWPFSRGGCDGHHYSEYEPTHELRTRTFWDRPKVVFEQKKNATCKHEGCDATKTTWELVVDVKHVDDLDEVWDAVIETLNEET